MGLPGLTKTANRSGPRESGRLQCSWTPRERESSCSIADKSTFYMHYMPEIPKLLATAELRWTRETEETIHGTKHKRQENRPRRRASTCWVRGFKLSLESGEVVPGHFIMPPGRDPCGQRRRTLHLTFECVLITPNLVDYRRKRGEKRPEIRRSTRDFYCLASRAGGLCGTQRASSVGLMR